MRRVSRSCFLVTLNGFLVALIHSTFLSNRLASSQMDDLSVEYEQEPVSETLRIKYFLVLRCAAAPGILYRHLGQFTRNYTQTTKRGLLTTNKG